MSAALFFEVRNRQLADKLRTAMGAQYTSKPTERVGTVQSDTQIIVSGQRYSLLNGGSNPQGSELTVYNIGRPAAAIYSTVAGSRTVKTTTGSVTLPGSGDGGGGTPLPGGITRWDVGSLTAIAGSGLTGTSTTINVGEGPGIDVTADAVGVGGDTILLYSATGSPVREEAATSTGLDTLLVGAAAGEVITLPACSISGDHTLPAGATLRGLSVRASILTGQITGAADAKLECLSVTRAANDASKLVAVVAPASGALYIDNCDLSAVQSGAGTGYAVQVGNGDVYIYNSRAYGSTAMTDE